MRSSDRTISSINSLLMFGFLAAGCVVFAAGISLADWSRLARADWQASARSLPTILQLFVYSEVTPTLCSMLNGDAGRIKRAILVGSLGLLLIELGWSALGLGLVPFFASGGGLRADPIDVLLQSAGPVATGIASLGACAVTTTIIGTYLALRAFFADALGSVTQASAALVAAVLMALAVASTSPEIFFGVIDFAGAYPVTLLWGCLPPLMALRSLPRRGRRKPVKRSVFLLCLFLASSALVASCARDDVMRVFGMSLHVARWQ
eukprot:TRINITY_DN77072_c0_g1_i1.p1 TRINITY_DN77072_c0_g1~~TRINITY_DN77072_c0_g1_i1.p1  ORF type:complete len:264 (+),score=44.54 TRINITY_DN77072_c0_g1_i1:1-792(+)